MPMWPLRWLSSLSCRNRGRWAHHLSEAAWSTTKLLSQTTVNLRKLAIVTMHIPSLIEKKRDGQELSVDEIGTLVADFTAGKVPDYQMSAWAMAVFFRGMTAEETRHLTHAMMNS